MFTIAMDPLDFLEDEQLLRFFRCKRTEMSCLEQPLTFLNQLRDFKLIPEESYKKVIRKKNKQTRQKGLYDVLDSIEKEQPQYIKLFWSCVFQDHLLTLYPSLRLLRNSLMDGSFQFYNLPEDVQGEEEEQKKKMNKKTPVESEEEDGGEKTSGKRRRKTRHMSGSGSGEEEQPGSSSVLTTGKRKRNQKPTYSSPLKKGERTAIWAWPLYKTQLPVTCGDKEGLLNRDKLAKGERCILVKGQWFTPPGFEAFAGKAKSKNWKLSIRCMDTTLAKLINEGHLQSGSFQSLNAKKVKRTLAYSEVLGKEDNEEEDDDGDEDQEEDDEGEEDSEQEESEEEEEEREEEEGEASTAASKTTVLRVTCRSLQGTLHTHRFASGERGLSVRTEKSWMTPVDFVREGLPLCEGDASWRKDIQWEDKPLSFLIEENQKNDDHCFACGSEGEKDHELVVCDQCPRSFHQSCHLPNVENDIIEAASQWMCTFCVLKASQQWRYPRQHTYNSALSCKISDHLMECQYLLLCLYNADENQIFAANPDAHVQGYSSRIKSPMWLDLIAEKLQQNRYQEIRPFFTDVKLIFTNCATFNRDNAEFKAMGVKVKELFEREFKSVFSIVDRSSAQTDLG